MRAIYYKELRSYFHSMFAWLFLSLYIAASGIFFSVMCLGYGYADYAQYVFENIQIVFVIIVPILTMRLLAEEKKQKTEQLLLTAPVRTTGIVLGKYFAVLTLFALTMVVSIAEAGIINCFGKVYWKTMITGCIGFFLLGASLLAIGLFLSSFVENQIIAAAATFGVVLIFLLLPNLSGMWPGRARYTYVVWLLIFIGLAVFFYSNTRSFVLSGGVFVISVALLLFAKCNHATMFDNGLAKMADWFSVFGRFEDFCVGIFNTSSVVYYISFILIFLFMTVQVIEKRRWK